MSPDRFETHASPTVATSSVASVTIVTTVTTSPTVPTVPCVYCRLDIAAGSFTFRTPTKRLVTATCPSCRRMNTLSTPTWRRWAGLSLPSALPKVGDLSVAAQYIPAGSAGEPIAGDFFDVVEIAPDRILIAVGDVSGHGVEAAMRMNILRAATHDVAADVESPVEILERLDRLQSLGEPEEIATLWLGNYNPRTGVLRYASAGHLPPVIAGFGDRTILLAEASAPPLGTGVVGTFVPLEEIFLPIGAYFVAFSDGLVERPDTDLEDQLGLLREIVERASGAVDHGPTSEQLVESVLSELIPDPSTARDDVCLVVIRRELDVTDTVSPYDGTAALA